MFEVNCSSWSPATIAPDRLDHQWRLHNLYFDNSQAGKVLARYHVVGSHGGAWIYDVDSNEELERLLGLAPVYNFARYTIYPLADMGPTRPGDSPAADGSDR